MQKVVYILGAGFSRKAGGPLVSDLFTPGAIPHSSTRKKTYELVCKLFHKFHVSYTSGNLNIEQFLGLLRDSRFWSFDNKIMTNLESLLAELSEDVNLGMNISDLYTGTIYALLDQITWCMEESTQNFTDIPTNYAKFARIIKKQEAVVLTFNYDILLEHSFTSIEVPYTYGLRNRCYKDRILLLKLHGSSNWWCCQGALGTTPYKIKKGRAWSHSKDLPACSVCSRRDCHMIPAICPPLWLKSPVDEFQNLWRKAGSALYHADKWVAIGFSFAAVDVSVRNLLSWAARRTRPPIVEVWSGKSLRANWLRAEAILPRNIDLYVYPEYFDGFIKANKS